MVAMTPDETTQAIAIGNDTQLVHCHGNRWQIVRYGTGIRMVTVGSCRECGAITVPYATGNYWHGFAWCIQCDLVQPVATTDAPDPTELQTWEGEGGYSPSDYEVRETMRSLLEREEMGA